MGEEWKALARRAPEFLHPVHAVDEHAMEARLPRLISAASDALNLRRGNLAQYQAGAGQIVDPLQQPVLPSTPLDQAISMLGEHHQLHTAGARFFALYGEHFAFLLPADAFQRDLVLFPGLATLDQLTHACWEQWLVNRAEAMDRKRDVSRKLRLAIAYDIACYDAVSVAGMLPAGSPIWQRLAWIQAAESHAARAHHQATEAAGYARQMSANAYLESWYATAILSRT